MCLEWLCGLHQLLEAQRLLVLRFTSSDRGVSGQEFDRPYWNKLFFYEAYERQFDADRSEWVVFEPEHSFKTDVVIPDLRKLEGFDVVTFSVRTSAECSPLSCNSLAERVQTNEHCLLPTLKSAQQLLEQGTFENTEPSPYRIFAVYSVEWPVREAR